MSAFLGFIFVAPVSMSNLDLIAPAFAQADGDIRLICRGTETAAVLEGGPRGSEVINISRTFHFFRTERDVKDEEHLIVDEAGQRLEGSREAAPRRQPVWVMQIDGGAEIQHEDYSRRILHRTGQFFFSRSYIKIEVSDGNFKVHRMSHVHDNTSEASITEIVHDYSLNIDRYSGNFTYEIYERTRRVSSQERIQTRARGTCEKIVRRRF
jgi:hypothetical protein